jgi:hypothetical protein
MSSNNFGATSKEKTREKNGRAKLYAADRISDSGHV